MSMLLWILIIAAGLLVVSAALRRPRAGQTPHENATGAHSHTSHRRSGGGCH